MNQTNFEHAGFALMMQIPFILLGLLVFNNPETLAWVGAAFASAFFMGRELCQAEYRWIASYGKGKRINLPWWGCFDPKVWNHLDSWFDWLAPTLVVVGLAGAIKFGLGG